MWSHRISPCEDDAAGLLEYADTVVDAIGDRTNLVVVAQSLGVFTAPLVCERILVKLLILSSLPKVAASSCVVAVQPRCRNSVVR